MFEAHFNHAEDFQGIETFETVVYSWTKTYYRRHKLNFKPLTIWFARGKRQSKNNQDQQRIFTYIEYQDAQGNNRYRTLELAATLSVAAALDKALHVDLGD